MADKNEQMNLGGTAIKPEGWDRSGMEAFKYFLYDPKNGTVMSRTPLSWLKIIVFYCIYYSCLAGFWLACLNVFFLTLPESAPRWTLDGSIIGSNPGVGIRPRMSDAKIDSSLFQFSVEDTSDTPTNDDGEGDANADYAKRTDIFMKNNTIPDGLFECTGNDDKNKGKCIFSTSTLGDCQEFPYGFIPEGSSIKPCFFIKLNKILEFSPEAIDPAELDNEEYESMSSQLKEIIRGQEAGPDNVYIDCMGRFAADKEGMELEFFPTTQNIPTMHFPYQGGNYQSPLVAVKVNPINIGQLLHIECRAWYKGVVHDTKHKAGLTQFEVMVDY